MKITSIIMLCVALLVGSLLLAIPAIADNEDDPILVVTHPKTSFKSLTERQLRKLYLGKSLKLPNGSLAVLVIYSPLKNEFNRRALRRTSAQVDAAWSRLKFSGRAKQPRVFQTPEQVLEFVASTPNTIAYLPAGLKLDQLRTLLLLN